MGPGTQLWLSTSVALCDRVETLISPLFSSLVSSLPSGELATALPELEGDFCEVEKQKPAFSRILSVQLGLCPSIAYQLSTRHFPLQVETLVTSPEGAGPGSRNPTQHLLAIFKKPQTPKASCLLQPGHSLC